MRISHAPSAEIAFEPIAPAPHHARMKVIQACYAWWSRRRALARTRRELHALNDHMLKDLGLQRGSIEARFR